MAITFNSSIDEAGARIAGIIASFGFDAHSAESGTVGDRAAKIVADGIHERSLRFEGPTGYWRSNAPATIDAKGFNAPNYETGEMIAAENIAGRVTNSHEECRIDYTDDPEIRARAEFANFKGQSHKKIIRRFMALDETINQKVRQGVAEDLVAHVERHDEGGWG